MQMISVERIMGYGKLESEGELNTSMNDKASILEWPKEGVIKLRKMKFKYAMEYPYVLKSISFKTKSCEKVSQYTNLII